MTNFLLNQRFGLLETSIKTVPDRVVVVSDFVSNLHEQEIRW